MPTGGAFECEPEPRVDDEIEVLCDADRVEFLRRYTIPADGGPVEVTDTLLDGVTTFVPVEPVGLCDDESPGEPCDHTTPVATTGLCLADSTPIAVTTERDCDGQVIRTGWLDLTTGAFSAGDPPAGTRACGETAAFDVSGAFCDIDPGTGDVFAIVLVEIERGPDGDITGTQLINPVDGSPYTLQGELSTCPVGVQQPKQDLTVLCDADDVAFVRDYRRDENGTIVGHSDYTLGGLAFTPSHPVGPCVPPEESPPEPCPIVEVLRQCRCDDVNGDGTDVVTYTELMGVDCDGQLSSLGSYDEDLTGPYEPINPVPCDDVAADSEQVVGVQAHRTEVADGATWDAAAFPLLQAITATNVDGPPSTITTAEGDSTLWPSETVSFSVVHDFDLTLQGPLQVTAGTGSTVTVQWTTGVVAP